MYSSNPVVNDLVPVIISVESGGNPNATSEVGAMGLMQLMPDTAKRFGVSNPYDPTQNRIAGTKYLEFLAGRYGNDPAKIATAYHAGEGNTDKYLSWLNNNPGQDSPNYNQWLQSRPSGVGKKTLAYRDKVMKKLGQPIKDSSNPSFSEQFAKNLGNSQSTALTQVGDQQSGDSQQTDTADTPLTIFGYVVNEWLTVNNAVIIGLASIFFIAGVWYFVNDIPKPAELIKV